MASALNFDADETVVSSEEETNLMYSDYHLSNNRPFKGTNGYRNDPENPFYKWLTMDVAVKEQSLRHMKNCIMSPFLFGEKRNYCKKHLVWLNSLDLIPTPRSSCSSLSDKFIEIADVVEDIVDTVFYCLSSEEFLLKSHHICNDLRDCSSVKEALLVGHRSDIVPLISNCFYGESSLDKHKHQLLSLTVLFQALSHVQQACKHGNHFIAKLDEEIKPKEQICMKLRLQGNKHFAVGEFKTAVLFYSRAILLSPFDPLLYGNRAQCYLKLNKLREALSDAKRAVCLKPEWEKGYYRYAQAYFELGYTEKAIAINAVAQKSCSSTLNLLLQAVVFDREASSSSQGSLPMKDSQEKIPDRHSNQEQSVSGDCRQHQACSDHRDVRGATAGCKRRRLVGSGFTLLLDMEEATSDSVLTETEGADDENDHKVNEECDISDSDSLPPLVNISSDDDDDDDLDVEVKLQDSDDLQSDSSVSSLDSMVSSDSDSDNDDMWQLRFACSDYELDSLFSASDHSLSGDDDSDNDNGDHDDDDDDDDGDDTESENNGDAGAISEGILRSLLCAQSFLGIPFNPAIFVEIIQGFLREHPEMLNEGSPPALPEVIESLPKVKISKEHVFCSSSCAICRCDYEQEEEALQLPCAHIFHPPCVITWLRMHATCPTCRDVLPH